MQSVTDVLRTKQRIQIEISHEQNVGAQNYKVTCVTVLKVLLHNAVRMFVS